MFPAGLPTELLEKDLDSRKRMSVAAAAALVQVTSLDTLKLIVASGEREFFRVASSDEGYGHQDFHREDYDRIFRILAYHVYQMTEAARG